MISTSLGVTGGVAASGSVAAAVGATTILGSSTLGGALGGIFIATTPIGWVVGAGLAGGALGYGATRLIRNGEVQDRAKKSIYERLKKRLASAETSSGYEAIDVPIQQFEIDNKDSYYDFVKQLRKAVSSRTISSEPAERLLGSVTSGAMGIQEAKSILGNTQSETTSEPSKPSQNQWLSLDTYRDLLQRSVLADVDPELDQLETYLHQHVPRIWLLGKTGAGKSSLISEITGQSDIEIGNGFEPCTGEITRYLYPTEQPIMEFLDTRGLSEAGYVATDDVSEASNNTHAILVVIKIDDPEQSAVIETLSKLQKQSLERVLVIYTTPHGINDPAESKRAVNHLHNLLKRQLKMNLPFVVVDFSTKTNVEALRERLSEMMPSAAVFLRQNVATTHEEKIYLNQREKILWHSGAAASADLVPGVGLIAVPSVQIKMLYQLAEAYGLAWHKQEILEFIGCLGAGFATSYGSRALVTQVGRFIPVWGQTIGQATAMALSFGLTFALGRGACYYMYQKRNGQEVDIDELKSVYEQALNRGNWDIQSGEKSA
ncbi:YcjF family protein [Congregibacter litoralis]|uniref:Uncharacterized protein/domain protein associated with GTPase n=1 Tax=Congregibacter litoralis KT71 TaxID=314285 RepID=A4AB49_9GAMM|nr:GTPase [Congregibacter litoralis]EAQ96921.2 Uncharacterized protein/domain protein associated with GTPase [Congregibacter litoralis KT71]